MVVLSNTDKNLCPISNNGEDTCGEQTSKLVIITNPSFPDERTMMWICQTHYDSQALKDWWASSDLIVEY